MTDGPTDDQPEDGLPMADDELGRLLRNEVPAPGPGYWDEIDRRLAAAAGPGAADDVGAADAVAAAGGGLVSPAGPTPTDRPVEWLGEKSDEVGDTGAEVIRLTDMTTRPTSRFTDAAPLLAAAAALLLVVAGAGFLLTRGQDDATTQVATEIDDDTGNGDETDEGDDADGSTSDSEPDGGSTPFPSVVRWCYQGGELGEGITAVVDLSAPLAETPQVRIANRTIVGGQTFYEVVDGTAAPDGTVSGDYRNLTDGTVFPATFVAVGEGSLSLADDVVVDAADCDDLAGDLAEIESTIAELEAAPTGTTDIEFLPEQAPSVWTIDADGPVQGRIAPGFGAEIVRTYNPGFNDPLSDGLFGTGRLATADGATWIEIQGIEEAAGSTWWVNADVLVPVETDGGDDGDGADFFPDADPAFWLALAETDAWAGPGLDAGVVGTVGPDVIALGTGRSALADELVWIELAPTTDRGAVWVVAEEVVVAHPGRQCYADAEQSPVGVLIALDWSQDRETFRGFIRDEINGTYLTVAGRRSDVDGIYDVNIAPDGSTEFASEPWEVIEGPGDLDDTIGTGDTPNPEVVCARVSTLDQAEVEVQVAASEFPPLP